MATIATYNELAAEVLNALPERVVRYRASDLVITYCNWSWAADEGLEPDEVVGHRLDEYLSEDGQVGLARQLARLGPDCPVAADDVPRADLAKPGRWIAWIDRYLPTGEIIAVGRDVTERHRLELALIDSEGRFRALADNSSDMVFRVLLRPQPHFDYLSPSVERITGFPVAYFVDDFARFIDLMDHRSASMLQRALNGGPMLERFDVHGRRANGEPQITEVHLTAIPGGFEGVGLDVTDRRALEADLTTRALHDPLTGLANRHLLDEVLERGLARAERQGTVLALIFVDIDDFKSINDQYSHHAGDAVLREFARRLEAASRRADVVARVGGDEFVVVYEPTANGHDNFLARIERALAPPIEVAPSTVLHCTASLGRVDTLTCPATATALLTAADAAMYQAKRAHHAAARSAAE